MDAPKTPTFVGIDEPPGEGSMSGGLTIYDHDSDPLTPPRTVLGGVGAIYEYPTTTSFDYERLTLESLAEDITNVKAVHLNPCVTPGANGACSSVDQDAAGLDNLMDLVVLTGAGKPSYTFLRDPSDPTEITFQEKRHIVDLMDDDRDVEVVDLNGDGVLDLVIATYDAADKIIYGDRLRPGMYDEMQYDFIDGTADGNSIAVEVGDFDLDPATPMEVVIASENKDTYIMHSGVPTAVTRLTYSSLETDSSDQKGTPTGLAVEQGLGIDANSYVIVISRTGGENYIVEWRKSDQEYHNPVDPLTPLTAATFRDGVTGDSNLFMKRLQTGVETNWQGVRIADMTGDGVPDIVMLINGATDRVARIYRMPAPSSAIENNPYTSVHEVGDSSVAGVVDMQLIDGNDDGTYETIQVLDEEGRLRHYESTDWLLQAQSAPDAGPTDGWQESTGGVIHADLDSDGYEDVATGGLLYLSSRAAVPGNFEDVPPILFWEGEPPLAVLPFDADNDGDIDLCVFPPGQAPPVILFNRGDGIMSEPEDVAVLTSATPPTGGWGTLTQKTVAAARLPEYTGGHTIVYVESGPSTGPIMRLSPSTGSTPATPAQWSTATVSRLVSTLTAAPLQIKAVPMHDACPETDQIVFVTGNEVAHQYASAACTSFDTFEVLTASESLTMDTGNLDGSHNEQGVPDQDDDLVTCGTNGNCNIYWGSTWNKILDEWSYEQLLASRTKTTTDAISNVNIRYVVLFDADDNGFDDILVGQAANRRIFYSTDETADTHSYTGVPFTGVNVNSDTATIESFHAVDLNLDGAVDILYAWPGEKARIVLSGTANRGSFDDKANNIIDDLMEKMNPTTLQVLDGTATVGTEEEPGAWWPAHSVDANQGLGQIVPSSTDRPHTTTIGEAVDASTIPEQNQCTVGASPVVPVTTRFYIEFPM